MAVIKVNLLPPRVKKERARRALLVVAVAASAMFLTLPAGIWYLRWQTAASLRADIKRIDHESMQYAGTIEKVQQLETQETGLAKRLEVLDKLIGRQSFWIHVLEMVSFAQTNARDLWLSAMSSRALVGADAGKLELDVEGYAFSIASIEDFQKTLQHSDFGAELMQPFNATKATLASQNVVKFSLKLKLKV